MVQIFCKKIMSNNLGASWIDEEFYGFTQPVSQEVVRNYFKALFVVANGDGIIAEKERNWIVGFAAAGGASESVIEELQKYSGDDDLNSLLAADPTLDLKYAGRALIRDAIQAASADGEYNSAEREALLKLAKQLNVSEDVVNQIEQSVVQIKKLRQQEIELLYPEGKPY